MRKHGIRPSFVQPEDLLDRLYKAWLADKLEELPEQDRKILERMEYADGKLREGGVESRYTNLLKDMATKFKSHQVSSRTLENDIKRAKRFFASVRSKDEIDYARGMAIEWYQRLIWKAEAAEDFRAAAKLMEGHDKIQGFLKDDPNIPDYQKVQRVPILVVNDATKLGVPEIENLEAELQRLRGSRKDFLESLDIEDAEYDQDEEDPLDGV